MQSVPDSSSEGPGEMAAPSAPPVTPPPSKTPPTTPPPSVTTQQSRLPKPGRLREERRPQIFRCMVVGPQGVGKTTFLKSLWHLENVENWPNALGESTVETQEYGPFRSRHNDFSVSVIDTPGYGDKMDSQDRLWAIENWVEDWLEKDLKDYRSGKVAQRSYIDCCFVFFAPHRASEVDLELMSILSKYTTVIPILSKADSYTKEELREFRRALDEVFATKGFNLFRFRKFRFHPSDEMWTVDSEPRELETEPRPRVLIAPFAVIGGSQPRSYPWGMADPQSPQDSGLMPLRYLLLANYPNLQEAAELKSRGRDGLRSKLLWFNRRVDRYLRTHQAQIATATKGWVVAVLLVLILALVFWNYSQRDHQNFDSEKASLIASHREFVQELNERHQLDMNQEASKCQGRLEQAKIILEGQITTLTQERNKKDGDSQTQLSLSKECTQALQTCTQALQTCTLDKSKLLAKITRLEMELPACEARCAYSFWQVASHLFILCLAFAAGALWKR